jgi:hypothetical protein
MIVTCFKVLSEYHRRGRRSEKSVEHALPGEGLKLEDFSHISINKENKIIAPEEFKRPESKSIK